MAAGGGGGCIVLFFHVWSRNKFLRASYGLLTASSTSHNLPTASLKPLHLFLVIVSGLVHGRHRTPRPPSGSHNPYGEREYIPPHALLESRWRPFWRPYSARLRQKKHLVCEGSFLVFYNAYKKRVGWQGLQRGVKFAGRAGGLGGFTPQYRSWGSGGR